MRSPFMEIFFNLMVFSEILQKCYLVARNGEPRIRSDSSASTQWRNYIVIFWMRLPSPISFTFMQSSANFDQIISWHPLPLGWCPLWEILDMTLLCYCANNTYIISFIINTILTIARPAVWPFCTLFAHALADRLAGRHHCGRSHRAVNTTCLQVIVRAICPNWTC